MSLYFLRFYCKFQFYCSKQCQNVIPVFCIQWRIWLKWFLSLLVQKTHFFLYGPTPRSSKFAMETFMKFDWHYSVKQWLTLILTNKHSKNENSHEPKNSHENHLTRVVSSRLWIFSNADSCFKSNKKATCISITYSIVDKTWWSNALEFKKILF